MLLSSELGLFCKPRGCPGYLQAVLYFYLSEHSQSILFIFLAKHASLQKATCMFSNGHWRRQCSPLQYPCLGTSQSQRSLAGYGPCGRKTRARQQLNQHHPWLPPVSTLTAGLRQSYIRSAQFNRLLHCWFSKAVFTSHSGLPAPVRHSPHAENQHRSRLRAPTSQASTLQCSLCCCAPSASRCISWAASLVRHVEELLGCGVAWCFLLMTLTFCMFGKNGTEVACPLTFSIPRRLSWKVLISKEEAHYTGGRKEERSVTWNVE